MTRVLYGLALALSAAVAFATADSRAATLDVGADSGVLFDTPDGWTACDEATRTLIKGASPRDAMEKLCGAFDSTGGARMVGDTEGSLVMSFAPAGQGAFPSSFFNQATDQVVAGASASMCASAFQVPPAKLSCVFKLDKVAGRAALVGHVTRPNSQFEIARMVVAQGNAGGLIFIFLANPSNAASQDGMDKVVASIRRAK